MTLPHIVTLYKKEYKFFATASSHTSEEGEKVENNLFEHLCKHYEILGYKKVKGWESKEVQATPENLYFDNCYSAETPSGECLLLSYGMLIPEDVKIYIEECACEGFSSDAYDEIGWDEVSPNNF